VSPERRILGPDDAEQYFEHRQQALADAPLAFSASPEDDLASSVDAVRGLLNRAPRSVVLGAMTDTLIGSVGIYRNHRLKCAHKVHVWGMYVSPQSRGHGIGRALLEAALDHARSLGGVSQVHLCVSEAAGAARGLYESVGFRIWGTEPDSLRYEGQSTAEHHMVLELPRGAV
jgi:ribosomal protein S18 acetylase RimI-like enzyme